MKYYKASRYSFEPPITEVEVEKETNSFVWIKKDRQAKISSHTRFSTSREEAKSFLVAHAKAACERLEKQFEQAIEHLKKMENL